VPLILGTVSYFGLLKVRLSFVRPHATLRLYPEFAMNVPPATTSGVVLRTRFAGLSAFVDGKGAHTKMEGEKWKVRSRGAP
jgi:hypothetical protein